MPHYNAYAVAFFLAEFFVGEGLVNWGMDPFLAACLVAVLTRYCSQDGPPQDPPKC